MPKIISKLSSDGGIIELVEQHKPDNIILEGRYCPLCDRPVFVGEFSPLGKVIRVETIFCGHEDCACFGFMEDVTKEEIFFIADSPVGERILPKSK
jgi:hypothetical protein